MQKILFLILFSCLCGSINAQQRPYYTQYVMNNYILNPAISGIENYTDVKLSYRNQWVGIEGAPQTFYFTIHGPIGKKDYRQTATSFDMKGENPRGKAYWEEYTAPEPHHGVGFSMVNYKTGYINRFFINASYAYHLGLSPKTNLAAGFAGGISTIGIDASQIKLANPIDPAIGNSIATLRRTKAELSAGLWLYSSDYFVGLSAQQIIPQKLQLVNNNYDKTTLVPHVFATAGYRFFLNDEISALPSVMLRYVPSEPIFADANIKLQYLDRFWVGGNIRLKEGFAAMTGFNISSTFNVSYSYEVNNSRYLLQSQQRGSHEIVLGFLLGNKYGDTCPRNVW
ncbi:MAG: type IX secretion system membrane protein PorP/SprF [Sphingobacteriales bacterium]|nr:type IX secretion system membrane protein PorP/SprF [Sphingobacteriales bacterium]